MARRQKNNAINVELFPFLSVLACVIGVLTLAIVAMALGQMDSEAIDAIEKAEEHMEREEEISELQAQQEELLSLIAQAEAIANALEAAREELQRLEEERDKAEDREKEFQEQNLTLLAEANALRRQIERLEEELEELRKEIERLKEELAERQLPPDPPNVVIKPSGSGEFDAQELRKVVFAECRSDAVLIYNDLTGDDVTRFPSRGIRTNLEFIELLDRFAVQDNRLVFLVRDDAYGTIVNAERIATERGVYNGKLPLLGQGKLDLSSFNDLIEGGGR